MQKTVQKIIPTLPGVYLFKNAQREIVYIGKAKSLRHRVNSYFQAHNKDWKVEEIRAVYADLDFIITKNETEAMLLEAELIQQYQPVLNTMFKTGQPFVYILFTSTQSALPTMLIVRNKKRKGAYFGPFLHKGQARRVHQFLMHTFQLNACNKKLENGCLDYHIGNCPGTCKTDFDRHEYLFRLELAKDVLRHQDKAFIEKIQQQIVRYNKEHAFEKSKRLAQYLDNFNIIFETIRTKYAPEKFTADIMIATTNRNPLSSTSSSELSTLLGTQSPIITIDCFDISHFQSQSMVGSCVRFTNGKPDKDKFRRFKIKTLTQQNDYAALQEIVTRRYKDSNDIPDLILIDGGKGQLSAAQAVLPQAHIVSLAKKEERLFGTHIKDGIPLDVKTASGKLLIELRDYTHHFAISYHRLRQRKEIAALTNE
jgi:excinuclease ABC subunit C